ncbi:hypothetical protein BJ508DRAFT_314400 [Ascobolus immersus RN42]|uniref:Uncharacterized protein n=1 Tax=Ascobolus immersus RN42 TaxID=1160509 RepID=A0A3N4HIR1_ASCIM|nr:hypothetical protein BJ508DRAFT_314400 [Ascobolus immersus RN42]
MQTVLGLVAEGVGRDRLIARCAQALEYNGEKTIVQVPRLNGKKPELRVKSASYCVLEKQSPREKRPTRKPTSQTTQIDQSSSSTFPTHPELREGGKSRTKTMQAILPVYTRPRENHPTQHSKRRRREKHDRTVLYLYWWLTKKGENKPATLDIHYYRSNRTILYFRQQQKEDLRSVRPHVHSVEHSNDTQEKPMALFEGFKGL